MIRIVVSALVTIQNQLLREAHPSDLQEMFESMRAIGKLAASVLTRHQAITFIYTDKISNQKVDCYMM